MPDWCNDIHEGDAAETLAQMPDSSVHMAMCSPPYFGLRDYDTDGQIGLEDSLDEYIDELVAVGDELRRVLREDGSWWLNLGDSYAGSGGAGGQWTSESSGSAEYAGSRGDAYNGQLKKSALRRKNKMLVPHRVAIALQDAGWVVRNDVTWVKPNPMPASVKDRLNTTTEQIFHLTPEPDYWYDLDAVREPYSESNKRCKEYQPKHGGAENDGWGSANHHDGGLLDDSQTYEDTMPLAGKNPGDVFEVTTKPFPDAHFAVYPPELCEKPIKATCPPEVCADCGAPYEREVERERLKRERPNAKTTPISEEWRSGSPNDYAGQTIENNGWTRTCDCDTDATIPGVALDPFAGAGTTCLVAKRLGRRFAGIELNPEYVAMAQKRVGVTVDEPERLLDDGETSLAAYGDGGNDA